MSALLAPNRKLVSLPLRGADWKALKKNVDIDKTTKDRIMAYWHFEADLKEQYFGMPEKKILEIVSLYFTDIFVYRVPEKCTSGHSR